MNNTTIAAKTKQGITTVPNTQSTVQPVVFKKAPSVLAGSRHVSVSNALMYSSDSSTPTVRNPLDVQIITQRTTISNRLGKKQDKNKFDDSIANPNIQKVNACYLPNDQDTLEVEYTVKFLGGVGVFDTCNDFEYQQEFLKKVSGYNFDVIAERYAINLLNGSTLWRNGQGAADISTEIFCNNKSIALVNSKKFSLRGNNVFNVPEEYKNTVANLTKLISDALGSEDDFVLFRVKIRSILGCGQPVFPSEMFIDEDVRGRTSKDEQVGRPLYTKDGTAAMTPQKISNALRTFDTWYEDYTNGQYDRPINVGEYGAVTNIGKSFRYRIRTFYDILDDSMAGKPISTDDMHYMVSVVLKGGVWGKSDK